MAHLLTHTGGFDERVIGAFARTPDDLQPLGAYLAEHMPPRVMPPGEVTSYSNHGLALAGYIVEVVSGMPFEQYVATHILQPLDMPHSSFAQPLPPALAADLALPYPQNLEAGSMFYAPIAPAGMLSTTAQDMAHFLIAHLQDGRYADAQILDEGTAMASPSGPRTVSACSTTAAPTRPASGVCSSCCRSKTWASLPSPTPVSGTTC